MWDGNKVLNRQRLFERVKIVYQVFEQEYNESLADKRINMFPYMMYMSLIMQADVPEPISENYFNIAVSLHWSNEEQSTIIRLQVVLLITRAIKE